MLAGTEHRPWFWLQTLPWFTLYSATKFALGALTDGLRMELRPHGIGAMLVCPGYVNTQFQAHVLEDPPEERERLVDVADLDRDVVDPDQPRHPARAYRAGPP